MANERYDEQAQEQEEYHFADDQINYDLEAPEVSKPAAPSGGEDSVGNVITMLKSRKIIIGIVIFIILLAIVYQMIMPTRSTPPTEFSNTPNKQSTAGNVTPPAQPMQAASTAFAPASPINNINTPVPSNIPTQIPQQPIVSQAPVTAPASAANLPPSTANTMPSTSGASGNLEIRVAALEQQNAALMNLLQSQAMQKSTYDAQNAEIQTKIQELNNKVAGMEVAFRQLTQILRHFRKQTGTGVMMSEGQGQQNVVSVPARSNQPKIGYTVQAIIPGRAWLKADNGETVTVAEGDVLKGYGRITKIDPYDGVVTIDTGNRVITLSYGANDGD